jgi:hypothetical protein
LPRIPSFDEYLASLGRLTTHADPTLVTAEKLEIRQAAAGLASLAEITVASLAAWVAEEPPRVRVLGLAVGLSQEKLRNVLKHHLGSAGWLTLGKERPGDVVAMLEREYDLVRLVTVQRSRTYDFGDVLVARAGTRQTANASAASGRKVEDEIEAIARQLGLPYETRTRFAGRDGRTAPCDLVVPSAGSAAIAVAAKGFDSTGSKLTDAVREIKEMAEVRLPRQFIMAVIDGIGWKNRLNDLRQIHHLWEREQIDGMYTLATLDRFQEDLLQAARLRNVAAT